MVFSIIIEGEFSLSKKTLVGIVIACIAFGVIFGIVISNAPKQTKQKKPSSYSSSSSAYGKSSSSESSKKKDSSGISDDLKSALALYAEDKVKAHLLSPSTAKFPLYSKYTYQKKDNVYTITGYVDAKNAYGTELRKSWGVMVEYDETHTMLVCVVIDGETYFD